MFQLYNSENGTYGTIFHDKRVACSFAHQFSKTFHSSRWVVDMNTGEIVGMFENGVDVL